MAPTVLQVEACRVGVRVRCRRGLGVAKGNIPLCRVGLGGERGWALMPDEDGWMIWGGGWRGGVCWGDAPPLARIGVEWDFIGAGCQGCFGGMGSCVCLVICACCVGIGMRGCGPAGGGCR